MPVNMDPAKKRKHASAEPSATAHQDGKPTDPAAAAFGTETHDDREKDLADAEWKNLWDATEVIDADTV